jgi:hypothetical protein
MEASRKPEQLRPGPAPHHGKTAARRTFELSTAAVDPDGEPIQRTANSQYPWKGYEPAKPIAWKARVRLCARYRRLAAIGKPKFVVTTRIAREMVGFIWATARIAQPEIILRGRRN